MSLASGLSRRLARGLVDGLAGGIRSLAARLVVLGALLWRSGGSDDHLVNGDDEIIT